jgi:hypothetical protein
MTRLSADTRYRRRLAWLHNGFIGSCAMTQGAMASIIDSPTATDGAKVLADQIRRDAMQLRELLKERIGP